MTQLVTKFFGKLIYGTTYGKVLLTNIETNNSKVLFTSNGNINGKVPLPNFGTNNGRVSYFLSLLNL